MRALLLLVSCNSFSLPIGSNDGGAARTDLGAVDSGAVDPPGSGVWSASCETPLGEWPMWRRCATHEARTDAVGPAVPHLAWSAPVGGAIEGAPAVAPDGTVHVFAGGQVTAVSSGGSVRWSTPSLRLSGSPAIAQDGTVLFGITGDTSVPYLVGLYPDGTNHDILWVRYELADSCAVLDGSGTAFYGASAFPPGTDGINPDAPPPRSPELWGSPLSDNRSEQWQDLSETLHWPPAIGPDGTLYLADSRLEARDLTQGLRWSFVPDAPLAQSPVVNGDLYIVDTADHLYAVAPDGTLRWKQPLVAPTAPAIGADGTLFVGAGTGLHAIAKDGSELWRFTSAGPVTHAAIIDGAGTIYFATASALWAVGADGSQRWHSDGVFTDLALAADGTIYVGSGAQLMALR